jgi:hypothetical protein
MRHVKIFQAMHDAVLNDIRGLEATGCHCPAKAQCYLDLAPRYRNLRRAEANLANTTFDCEEYGKAIAPWKCEEAEALKESVPLLQGWVQNLRAKCDRMRE